MPPGVEGMADPLGNNRSGIENFEAGLWTTDYVDEPVCQLPAGNELSAREPGSGRLRAAAPASKAFGRKIWRIHNKLHM